MRAFGLEKEPPMMLGDGRGSVMTPELAAKMRIGVAVRSASEHGLNKLKRRRENLRHRRWLWDRKGGIHHNGERQRNESPVTGHWV
jgi:hypothetical protein